jgi:WD40 repeat protein
MLEIIELDNRRLAGEIFPVPNLMGFDVSSSGTQILTTSSRGTLNLWDTEAGTVIRFFTKKASKNLAMRKIEFTSDNSMFVGLPMDGGALVWKTSESSPVTAIGNGSTFVSGEVSVDGHSLLTVSFDHRASTWDLRTGERLALSVPNVEVARWVTGSPNLIVTISSRNLLRIWSIRQQASCCPYIANEPLQEVNLKPSAGKIAIIKNEAIRVYGTDTLRPPQASIPHPKNSWVHDVLLSSDGAFVACSTLSQSGEMLSVWASASGRRIGPQVPSASGRQLGFGDLGYQFSPDSSLIAIIRNLGSLDLWDFHNGNHSIKLIHGDKLVAFRFSPKGDKIVTTGFDNKVKIWKTSSGMLLSEFFAKDVQFSTASFSPDGDFLVSGSLQGKVFKWNIESGQLVKLSGPLDEVLMVTFDSTGRFLVLTSSESVTILDSETMEPIGPPIRNADFASSASLDAKGERILLVHQQDRKTAGLWDVRAGKLLTSFVSSDGILDAQLSLDGNRLWFADSQGLKVFDVPILPAGETEPLARLAEAVAGYEVNDEGRLLSIQDRIHRLNELRRETANAPPRQARAQSLIRWFLADWRSRSLSPLSEITVPEYIRQRLAEGPDAREEILRTFPGHPLLRNVTWPETAGNHRSP